MRVVGIDEAGRGCIIGPMVVAGVLVEGDHVEGLLKKAGAKDSKALSPQKRNDILPALKALVRDIRLVEYSAKRIDETNINTLELDAMAQIVSAFKPDLVIVDLPVNPKGAKNFGDRLERLLLPLQPQLVLENRADAKYPVVAAASIFAKVRRDECVAKLRCQFGDFGSGYPSDPLTRTFLTAQWRTNMQLTEHVRSRWSTLDALGLRQGVLF